MSCAPGVKIFKHSESIAKAEGDEPAVCSAHTQGFREKPTMPSCKIHCLYSIRLRWFGRVGAQMRKAGFQLTNLPY